MQKPYHIIFTTVNYPDVLNGLYRNISHFNHLDSVKVWIVGDRKTPESCGTLAADISQKGLETVFLDIRRQDEWGRNYSELYRRIPFNNETRRNIGYLHALADGCEVLVSIDDDNFPVADDFIGSHQYTGQLWKKTLLKESSGFHNIYEHLEFLPDRPVFPRGYPFGLRDISNQAQEVNDPGKARIGVIQGLCLLSPDLDAAAWLNGSVKGLAYKGDDHYLMDQGTWIPINTQNTSVIRDLIPAFFCIPMGWALPGGEIQRYGDIWGGYFLQALMQGTEYHVAFGRPLVEHRRNPHEYLDDLRFEFWGMILTDWLVGILKDRFVPERSELTERIVELSDFIKVCMIPEMPDWCPEALKEFMHWTAENLKAWAGVCRLFL